MGMESGRVKAKDMPAFIGEYRMVNIRGINKNPSNIEVLSPPRDQDPGRPS